MTKYQKNYKTDIKKKKLKEILQNTKKITRELKNTKNNKIMKKPKNNMCIYIHDIIYIHEIDMSVVFCDLNLLLVFCGIILYDLFCGEQC